MAGNSSGSVTNNPRQQADEIFILHIYAYKAEAQQLYWPVKTTHAKLVFTCDCERLLAHKANKPEKQIHFLLATMSTS